MVSCKRGSGKGKPSQRVLVSAQRGYWTTQNAIGVRRRIERNKNVCVDTGMPFPPNETMKKHFTKKTRKLTPIAVVLIAAVGILVALESISSVVFFQRHGEYPLAFVHMIAAVRSRLNAYVGRTEPGRWHKSEENVRFDNVSSEQELALQQLRSIGYVAGSQPAPLARDITIFDKAKAYSGLNLVVSGHAPEAILMDMEGHEIHRWHCDVFRAWPQFSVREHFGTKATSLHTFWRRAHLLENGELLAIFEGIGLLKLDKESRIIWAAFNGAHHDLYVSRNGTIYVLTREAILKEKFLQQQPILENHISVLDASGNELQKISIFEILENSDFSPLLRRIPEKGDIFHTNTIELIEETPGKNPSIFKTGSVLISILNLQFVGVVDLEERRVYWGESDLWYGQHQPTLLEDGNILVFDNRGADDTSAVLEIDPVVREIRWYYRGTEDSPFYTRTCGAAQRLPNGNTLITESDRGRAFEVTPEKTIVWEYVNPHRAGKDKELIATLFEVVRLKEDFPTEWLPAGN